MYWNRNGFGFGVACGAVAQATVGAVFADKRRARDLAVRDELGEVGDDAERARAGIPCRLCFGERIDRLHVTAMIEGSAGKSRLMAVRRVQRCFGD